MHYVIAIPTYNREDIISKKTLKTLLEGGVNKNKIYLFVANKEQYKLYYENVPKNMYKEIIIGKLGITNQRKFISKYFPENQYIISIDDDVEELLILKDSTKLVLSLTNHSLKKILI
jgi:5,10-methylenetetrahydrofolate reductase